MFVVILRRTVQRENGGWAAAAGEAALAQACDCSAVQILRPLENRSDIFAVSHWATRAAADHYVREVAAVNPALVASEDGLELRAPPDPGGTSRLHLIVAEEHISVSR